MGSRPIETLLFKDPISKRLQKGYRSFGRKTCRQLFIISSLTKEKYLESPLKGEKYQIA